MIVGNIMQTIAIAASIMFVVLPIVVFLCVKVGVIAFYCGRDFVDRQKGKK
jgi:hypothetical protein